MICEHWSESMRCYEVRKLVIVIVQYANVYMLDIVILTVSAAVRIVRALYI
jgi:hypothetical protein